MLVHEDLGFIDVNMYSTCWYGPFVFYDMLTCTSLFVLFPSYNGCLVSSRWLAAYCNICEVQSHLNLVLIELRQQL